MLVFEGVRDDGLDCVGAAFELACDEDRDEGFDVACARECECECEFEGEELEGKVSTLLTVSRTCSTVSALSDTPDRLLDALSPRVRLADRLDRELTWLLASAGPR